MRAEQAISGVIRIVTSRSRGFSITRADMMAGIAQACAESIGTNALPGRPNRRMILSITNAARAQVAGVFQQRQREK